MARPNDLCRCGSGLKYKKCCLKKKRAAKAASKLPSARAPWRPRPREDLYLTVDFYSFPEGCRESVIERVFSRANEFTPSRGNYRFKTPGEPDVLVGVGDRGLMAGSYSIASANLLKERLLHLAGDLVTHLERDSMNMTEVFQEARQGCHQGPTVRDVLRRPGGENRSDELHAELRQLDRRYGGDALLAETSLSDGVTSFLSWRNQQKNVALFQKEQKILEVLLEHLDEHGWELVQMEPADVRFSQIAPFHGLLKVAPDFIAWAAVEPDLAPASLEEIGDTLKAVTRYWTDQSLLSERGYKETTIAGRAS